ncbi:MAG TPA: SRPBCC family protein [Burkholderiales bacterium]|nr:SRPBCC family protein [Burkholderiales bacterium]
MTGTSARSLAAAYAAALLASLGAGTAWAAQLDDVTVSKGDAGLRLAFDARVNAPEHRVFEVLSDYARFGRMNPAIVSMSVAAAPDGRGARVRSVLKSCVWFFCRKVVTVEDVTQPDSRTIVARIVPNEGDFESGSSIWRLTAEGGRTRLHYESTRVASFWIPPLIGPWAIKRTLREQLESSLRALEQLAGQKSPAQGR